MKVSELFEISMGDKFSQARNMYGNNHAKIQSHMNQPEYSSGGDDDGYSHKEWVQDWMNDHKEFCNRITQIIDRDPRRAVQEFRNAFPELDQHEMDSIFDEVSDIMYAA